MKRIFKYVFNDVGQHTLKLEKGSEVIHFDVQGEKFCIWVLVDPDQYLYDNRMFFIKATGDNVDTFIWKHIQSVVVEKWREVWHLFEKRT